MLSIDIKRPSVPHVPLSMRTLGLPDTISKSYISGGQKLSKRYGTHGTVVHEGELKKVEQGFFDVLILTPSKNISTCSVTGPIRAADYAPCPLWGIFREARVHSFERWEYCRAGLRASVVRFSGKFVDHSLLRRKPRYSPLHGKNQHASNMRENPIRVRSEYSKHARKAFPTFAVTAVVTRIIVRVISLCFFLVG